MLALALSNQSPPKPSQRMSTSWVVDGVEVTVATNRGSGETLYSWKTRHEAAVKEAGI